MSHEKIPGCDAFSGLKKICFKSTSTHTHSVPWQNLISKLALTVVLNSNFTAVRKYFINMDSLSQYYLPSK